VDECKPLGVGSVWGSAIAGLLCALLALVGRCRLTLLNPG